MSTFISILLAAFLIIVILKSIKWFVGFFIKLSWGIVCFFVPILIIASTQMDVLDFLWKGFLVMLHYIFY